MRTDQNPEQTPTRLADYRSTGLDRRACPPDLRPRTRPRPACAPVCAFAGAKGGELRLDGCKLTLVSAGDRWRGRDRPGGDGPRGADPDRPLARPPLNGPARPRVDPKANTELEGLYLSKGMFCTQCEAEGFRKITYWPDRPDVMAVFDVRIEGDIENRPAGAAFERQPRRQRAPARRATLSLNGTTRTQNPPISSRWLPAIWSRTVRQLHHRQRAQRGQLKIWVRPGDEDEMRLCNGQL